MWYPTRWVQILQSLDVKVLDAVEGGIEEESSADK